MCQKNRKMFHSLGGGWSKSGFLLIAFITVMILYIVNRENDMRHSYKVVFKNAEMSNYNDKWKFAESNSDYWILETQFMTRYSYPTDVIFVGDSITYRCQWNEIFPELDVKNRGIPSDTTEGVYARLDSIIKTQPKKIFIMIGINDIAQHVEEKKILDNYCNIINKLSEKPDVKIYVQSILPIGQNNEESIPVETIKKLNNSIKALCNDKEVKYVDLYPSFSDDEGYLLDQYSADGIHINAEGYECWMNIIKDYVY